MKRDEMVASGIAFVVAALATSVYLVFGRAEPWIPPVGLAAAGAIFLVMAIFKRGENHG